MSTSSSIRQRTASKKLMEDEELQLQEQQQMSKNKENSMNEEEEEQRQEQMQMQTTQQVKEDKRRALLGNVYVDAEIRKETEIALAKQSSEADTKALKAQIDAITKGLELLQQTAGSIKEDTVKISGIKETLDETRKDIHKMSSDIKKSFWALNQKLSSWCSNESYLGWLRCLFALILSIFQLLILFNKLYLKIWRISAKFLYHFNLLKYIPFISVIAPLGDIFIEIALFSIFLVIWVSILSTVPFIGGNSIVWAETIITTMWLVLRTLVVNGYLLFKNSVQNEEFNGLFKRIFSTPLKDVEILTETVLGYGENMTISIKEYGETLANETATYFKSAVYNSTAEAIKSVPSSAVTWGKRAITDTLWSFLSPSPSPSSDESNQLHITDNSGGGGERGKRRTTKKKGGKKSKKNNKKGGRKYTYKKGMKKQIYKGGYTGEVPVIIEKLTAINKTIFAETFKRLSSNQANTTTVSTLSTSYEITGLSNLLEKNKLAALMKLAEMYFDNFMRLISYMDEMNQKVEENPVMELTEDNFYKMSNAVIDKLDRAKLLY